MSFNSIEYGIFLLVIFVLFWIVSKRLRIAHTLLLAGSYFFYGSWNTKYLALILFVTLLNYVIGLLLAREDSLPKRRFLLSLSLVGSLGVLAAFKYANFFARAAFWSSYYYFSIRFPLYHVDWLLPVGISFYTFQSLSYTIDLYRREIEPCRNLRDFALFVAFFPQLVAGPILRAKNFLPQLKMIKEYSNDMVSSGIYHILRGLVKKVIIADYLAMHLVDPAYADPAAQGSLTMLLAVYGFSLQIYGDFSGYSDIAIGSAKLLGFKIPKNFDAPYKAQNYREFWQRWHISLSTWLQDYLYVSLGGSRRTVSRTYINLIITMVLGGLWHGAGWNFVLWGLYCGIVLALTRVYQRNIAPKNPSKNPFVLCIKIFLTFSVHSFGLIIFRSVKLSDIGVVLTTILPGDNWISGLSGRLMIVFALAIITHYLPKQLDERAEALFIRAPAVAQGLILALALGLFNLFSAAANPFFYFQF